MSARQLNELLLHTETKKQVINLLKKPSNSVLILGANGSGKLTLAKALAAKLLNLKLAAELTKYPYFWHVQKANDRQDISIDAIRQVIRMLKLKTTGSGAIRRVILIEDAQNLSQEAQNAILKILEEPATDTVFLLTAPYALSLLPTIVSRCQILHVYPVSKVQTVDYFSKNYSLKKIETTWQLGQGAPALMQALLDDDSSHQLKQAVDQVKAFLKQPKYERLLTMDKLIKNKDDYRVFLEALSRVLTALHYSAVSRNNIKQSDKLLHDRRLLMSVTSGIDKNANLKLSNLKLLLNINL